MPDVKVVLQWKETVVKLVNNGCTLRDALLKVKATTSKYLDARKIDSSFAERMDLALKNRVS